MIQQVLIQQRPTSRFWVQSRDAAPDAFALFVRHYSYRRSRLRKFAGGKFIGPGEYIVLLTPDNLALFAWRRFRSMDHQEGVNCSVFRNEGPQRSSELILDAEDWCQRRWPGERMYTYVNARRVKSANPGFCFKCAGWQFSGLTTKGLHILEKQPERGRG